MKRVIFIVVVSAACLIFKSVVMKPASGVSISNVQNVSCAGGTWQAVMASHGGTVDQIVFSSPGANFTLSESASGYVVNYAATGFGGESSLREERVSSSVCVFDQEHGLRSVSYSGSVDSLAEKIRKREKLDLTL